MTLHIENLRIKNHLGSKKLRTTILFFIFFNSFLYGQTTKCNVSLNVEKQRNTRSTTLEGTYYAMILTNISATQSTYTLTSENRNLDCQNPDNTSSNDNVELKINFLYEKLKPINEISIQSGQKIKFFVHITVPKNTNINKWSCTEILANSKECTDYEVRTLIKTLVISASED